MKKMPEQFILKVESWGTLGFTGAVYGTQADAQEEYKDPIFWVKTGYPYYRTPRSFMSNHTEPYIACSEAKIIKLFNKAVKAWIENCHYTVAYYEAKAVIPVEVVKL